MKFSEFREAMIKPASQTVPDPTTPSPAKMIGSRRVFRDWNSPPWDLDWLDELMCPECAGDLTTTESQSNNILFYDCTSDKSHKFVRIFSQPKATRPVETS